MTIYISLLRGINVGGSKILSMDALCDIYTGLGFSHVRTYLQSGNVVFTSPLADQALISGQIESHIQQVCSFHVDVFLRDLANFQRILAKNPFLNLGTGNNSILHVSFLYRAPLETAWVKLDVPRDIPDKLSRAEQEIYLYYPNGSAKTKIPTSYLEKVLGVPITDRNWNTVNALYKIAAEL